jgi:hypothetical protein
MLSSLSKPKIARNDVLVSTRYSMTKELITPYFRPIIAEDEPFDNIPAPQSNYMPYDLFVFRTKFERYLYKIAPTYSFAFVSKIEGDINRLTIELYHGKQFVVLSTEEARRYQNAIDDIFSLHPGWCLLLDIDVMIQEQNTQIPKGWVSALLPFLALNTEVQDVEWILDRGNIYIDLSSHPTDYTDYYKMFRDLVLEKIQVYFARGVIPCSPIFHQNTIEAFELEKVHDLIDAFQYTGPMYLYEAKWSDTRFAPNKVSFLYDRLQGKDYMSLDVGDNYVRRHFVAAALYDWMEMRPHLFPKDYKPIFSGTKVLVPTNNLKECRQWADLVFKAQYQSEGKVEIVPLFDPSEEEKVRANIESLYPKIDFGKHILMYRQYDQPPYIVSFVLPNNVGADTLHILN